MKQKRNRLEVGRNVHVYWVNYVVQVDGETIEGNGEFHFPGSPKAIEHVRSIEAMIAYNYQPIGKEDGPKPVVVVRDWKFLRHQRVAVPVAPEPGPGKAA